MRAYAEIYDSRAISVCNAFAVFKPFVDVRHALDFVGYRGGEDCVFTVNDFRIAIDCGSLRSIDCPLRIIGDVALKRRFVGCLTAVFVKPTGKGISRF